MRRTQVLQCPHIHSQVIIIWIPLRLFASKGEKKKKEKETSEACLQGHAVSINPRIGSKHLVIKAARAICYIDVIGLRSHLIHNVFVLP